MSKLIVTETNVPKLLGSLKDGEWLVPQFQRDFVWSNAAVISLLNSIIDAKPVGMVTLWEQEDQSALELEHVSIADSIGGKSGPRYFGNNAARPGRYYAVLDGRQRSTALALAFGGLRASHGGYRHSGRYFLDVGAQDDNERVVYVSAKDIERNGYTSLSSCISAGLFPLDVTDPDSIYETWMDYLQAIKNPANYPNGLIPTDQEIARRNIVLRKAFNGIINTKIAVYIVPKDYSLADICEIFETLNTTGTKVSTVDLIHSWLYSDTVDKPSGPILLRDEIDELGELDGAIGWSNSKDRPELIAQFVAAAHVALDNKPSPRMISGAKPVRISSVKAPDLLAIPSSFWERVFAEKAKFASILGDFQLATAGGHFTMNHCPYPASASVYFGLRWFLEFDRAPGAFWEKEHLDNLFRAFFWRNVFLNRYDQGFLSQIGTDIGLMKDFLASTKGNVPFESWRDSANSWLDQIMEREVTEDSIREVVSDGSQAGALRRGALLLLIARSSKDVIHPDLNIQVSSGDMDLHHIYPKDWCRNNSTGALRAILDNEPRDWVNSAANLIPMHRSTNLMWRKQNPGQFLEAGNISYEANESLWLNYFITREAFQMLKRGADGLPSFWEARRNAIARAIYQKTIV